MRLGAIAVCFAVVAFISLGCGMGSSGGGDKTPNALPTNDKGTPLSFAEARDAFVQRLDAIGPNIGSVPPDVQQQIMQQCSLLTHYAGQGGIDEICRAVQRAVDRGDPGLIDLVLRDLRALAAK